MIRPPYHGRLAPSPTGHLHLGHVKTFATAAQRARDAGGRISLRIDDLDVARCRPEFTQSAIDDLRWLGLDWTPPIIRQSERISLYREAMMRLHAGGHIYPCHRSRRDVEAAVTAPHEGGEHDEPIFPIEWRPEPNASFPPPTEPTGCNWRFRVPDGEALSFDDSACGSQTALAGRDFGDFVIWRKDDVPSYQLASTVDDMLMGITEIVRGADLLKSTFRQILIFRALGSKTPDFHHCPLILDANGQRLAKRHDALSIRALRDSGRTPTQILALNS